DSLVVVFSPHHNPTEFDSSVNDPRLQARVFLFVHEMMLGFGVEVVSEMKGRGDRSAKPFVFRDASSLLKAH
ncbi:MAG: hypothetical protein AAF349_17915, partial [Cyanobacteria bacterium P01_A01_bin.68]